MSVFHCTPMVSHSALLFKMLAQEYPCTSAHAVSSNYCLDV